MTHALAEALKQAAGAWPSRRWVIALSGGVDSRTMLHVAGSIREAAGVALRAIHVDHGLHAQSAQWADRCAQWCAAADVPIDVVRVQVSRIAELGLEGAARDARHGAFAERLHDDEVLIVAHHRDDQAETFLLRALRSPGHDGLAGMRPLRRFACGWLARPWLDMSRADIRAEAERAGLAWIDDPANDELAHDRNFLRHAVLPLLTKRWPQAVSALATSAARARDLLDLADPEVQRQLARFRPLDPHVIDRRVLDLPDGTATAVLKAWLRDIGWPLPTPATWREILRQLRDARADRNPTVRYGAVAVRRYRDHLHATAATPTAPPEPTAWQGRCAITLSNGLILPALPDALVGTFEVRPRAGHERLRIHARRPHRPLRLLFQEFGVPPWQRDALPCVWHGDTLLAVGDLFVDADFAARLRDAGHVWRVESASASG